MTGGEDELVLVKVRGRDWNEGLAVLRQVFVRFQPEALELYSLGASGSLMHLALNHTQPTTNTFAAILHDIAYTSTARLKQSSSNNHEKKLDQTYQYLEAK